MSDVITMARKLGAALQADPAYIRFAKATLDNDRDEELQKKIGEFNIKRMNLDAEISKDDRDDDKIREMNEELRKIYNEVMESPAMKEYTEAKNGVDKILSEVNGIISMCAQGEDPETCEPGNCTGNCSSCAGCH